ncbi:unnamed protein product [Aureobasidium mustum]|uniref:laccase n=1 Tax=Aureobasidium mustum TaxID=2773714 RepID=A0A9N8P9Q9_9PEZI|nr:unnamed protein product [Aureobasidium mustum]
MHFQKLTGICLLAFASVSWADATPEGRYLWGADRMGKMVRRATTSTSSVSSSTSLVADAACTNGPNSRQCWSSGFSVKTDFDQKHPVTGNTVTYNLEITNTTCNPDGNGAIECFLINGQQPGPVITANWGDQVVINVKNSLQNNGSSFHWHGVRQLNSVGSDGVGGLTECPIPPGGSRTYTFLATQFGTSWYHSHYSSQYGMGVTGTIVINGPATSNYDIDLGPFPLSDWYYGLATRVNDITLYNLQNNAPPPNGDNILVNGKGMSASGAGAYAQMTLTKGKRHRLRLINTSVDNAIRVKLDGHNLTVIAADFIPTKPLTGQDWILLAVGQRYDVIFTANQTPGNYFFRAEAATDCFSGNNKGGRALFTYSGVTAANPTDSNEVPPSNGCTELNTVPYWTQAVDQTQYQAQVKTLSTGVAPGLTTNGQNFALWHLDTTAMMVNWDKPTLQYVFEQNTSYPDPYAVIEIPTEGTWTYWLIQMGQQNPLPHPIHLHGHDFFVLGSGAGVFDSSTANLNFANPPRRDTSILPGLGWLLIAFPANNPGIWLMHCHIAWHISEGLGVQFIEAKNSIQMPDQSQFNSQCDAWRSYSKDMAYPQIDSGL